MRAGSQTWVSRTEHVTGPTPSCQAMSDMLPSREECAAARTDSDNPAASQEPARPIAGTRLRICISESALPSRRHPGVCSLPPVETG